MRYIRTITVGVFVLMLAAWVATTFVFNRNVDKVKPVITSDADEVQVSVEDGEESLFQGLHASDDRDGDLTKDIIIGKRSKFIEKGVCEVTYLVFDSGNNVGEYKRKVKYEDYESPQFQLKGPLVYGVGESITILDRLTAEDCIEGDISDKIKVVSGNVNKSQPGTYTMGVEARNSFGDYIFAELPVTIVEADENVPEIELNAYLVQLNTGDSFQPDSYLKSVTLTDGSTASTEAVQIDAQVNTAKAGTYPVLYSYTEAPGIVGYASLAVVVEE